MNTRLLEQVIAGDAPGLVPWTVEQVHRMLSAGVLPEGAEIELVEGCLVHRDRSDSPGDARAHGPRHAVTVKKSYRAFDTRLAGTNVHAQSQRPVELSADTAPEPDVSIVDGAPDDYPDRHPTAAETHAVVEIAGTSLRYDRTTKQRLYADAAIPVYIVVDLSARQIEVHTQPLPGQGRYAAQEVVHAGQEVHLALRDGTPLAIPASEPLP